MTDEHQPLVADALDGQSGPPPGIGDQAKVHLVVQHQLMHPVNVFVADLDLNPWERLPELPEHGLELMQAEAEAGGQFKVVGGGFADPLHLPVQFPAKPENLKAMRVAEFHPPESVGNVTGSRTANRTPNSSSRAENNWLALAVVRPFFCAARENFRIQPHRRTPSRSPSAWGLDLAENEISVNGGGSWL